MMRMGSRESQIQDQMTVVFSFLHRQRRSSRCKFPRRMEVDTRRWSCAVSRNNWHNHAIHLVANVPKANTRGP